MHGYKLQHIQYLNTSQMKMGMTSMRLQSLSSCVSCVLGVGRCVMVMCVHTHTHTRTHKVGRGGGGRGGGGEGLERKEDESQRDSVHPYAKH